MRSEPRVKRWLDRGWGHPAAGGERQALSVLLAARRSAINASTEAQQQVFSLVIAAPEPIRVRFRGQKLAAMLNTAANLRVHACWDTETTSTVVALRTLARRAHAMLKEARELQKAIAAIIRSWRPDLLEEFGVGPIVAATEELAWEKAHATLDALQTHRVAGLGKVPANAPAPQNVGSQRLLDIAKKGEVQDRALWYPTVTATNARGASTALVGSYQTVIDSIVDYVDLGCELISIRGYDNLNDAVDYGRYILPGVRRALEKREQNGNENGVVEKVAAAVESVTVRDG